MFEWQPEYSVGVDTIDDQHKKLLQLMKELHDASTVGKARSVVLQVLEGVVTYTKEHFATEEALMRQHEYQEYAAHKQMHDLLVREASELLTKAKTHSIAVSLDVMSFLESWLQHHISAADQRLGAFLQQKGVR